MESWGRKCNCNIHVICIFYIELKRMKKKKPPTFFLCSQMKAQGICTHEVCNVFTKKNQLQQTGWKMHSVPDQALSGEVEEFGSNPWCGCKPEGFGTTTHTSYLVFQDCSFFHLAFLVFCFFSPVHWTSVNLDTNLHFYQFPVPSTSPRNPTNMRNYQVL